MKYIQKKNGYFYKEFEKLYKTINQNSLDISL